MKIIVAICLLAVVMSCSKEKDKIKQLTIIDSIKVDENDNFYISAVDMAVDNDTLFVLNGTENKIYLFDCNTMEFIRSIASKGRGPGEIGGSFSFALDKDKNIVVSDFGNSRLMWFDKLGNNFKTLRTTRPFKVYNYNDSIFVLDLPRHPELSLRVLDNDTLKVALKLIPFYDRLGIKDDFRDCNVIIKNKNIFFLTSVIYPNIYKVTGSKVEVLKDHFDDGNSYKMQSVHDNIATTKNSFFVVHSFINNIDDSVYEDALSEISEEFLTQNKEYLCEYSYSGKLLNTWKIPDRVFFANGNITVSNNHVYLQDMVTENIYKLRM